MQERIMRTNRKNQSGKKKGVFEIAGVEVKKRKGQNGNGRECAT